MAKELTVAENLRLLYELQLVDSQTDEVEILKGELPMEVHDLEDEIAGLDTRLHRLKENVEDLDGELSRHKANIMEAEALIVRYGKQMDNVKNDREHEALTKEIELQRLEIQLSEKKIKEIEQVKEAKVETVEATEKRLEGKKSDLEGKKVELEKIIVKTKKNEEKLRRSSERARKKVAPRLLKSYDKIRASYRNGLAVVRVERHSCGGCFNKVPPQLQLEIGMRKKIMVCEHCGRILVDDNIRDVGKKVPEPKEEAASEAK